MNGVTEKMPFGKFARRYDSILVFYVLGHMFCYIDVDNFTGVTVKSTPEDIEELRGHRASVENPLNQSLRHWITLTFNGDVHDREIYELVERAYGLVKRKYSPQERGQKN